MTIKVHSQWRIERQARFVYVEKTEPREEPLILKATWVRTPRFMEWEPTFTEDGQEFLQAALDAAWDAGLRPAGYLDTRESMKATQAHLEDMRKLTFDLLETAKAPPLFVSPA